MTTIITNNPGETEALGESWGRAAGRGCVFALVGDLGAGKTALVRGLARGLGVTARVHSPTFAIVNEYRGGRLPLYHLDLYRLETPSQILGAGLDGYLEPDGVTAIEWAERLRDNAESRRTPDLAPNISGGSGVTVWRWVRMSVYGENERRIEYDDSGA